MLSHDELFNILMQSQEATAIFTSADLTIELANEKMLTIWGKDESIIGLPLNKDIPGRVGHPHIEILEQVWKTGETFHATQMPEQVLIGGVASTKYYDFEYRALKNKEGEMVCIYHVSKEVTQKVMDHINIEEAELEINILHKNAQLDKNELQKKNSILEENNKIIKTSDDNYRKVSKHLLHSRKELNFAIEAAGLGFFDLDVNSTRFKANHKTKEWFHLPQEEDILLSDAIAAMVPEDQERVTEAINNAFVYESGGDYEITYNVTNPGNAEPRTLYAHGKVLFNEEKLPVRFSGILQDVTDEAQDDKRKNDFIGMVSHELKTPLTTLNSALQLLQLTMNEDDVAMKSTLNQKALNQVNKMTSMVNGFLTIGALDSGKILLKRSIFNVKDLVQNVIDESEPVYRNHHIKMEEGCDIPLHADKNKIYTVLANLVSNASKYSPTGSTILLACDQKNNKVVLSVKDFGEGIEQSELEKIFARYYRVLNDKTSTTPGFGIGLYLCAEIVKVHGGKIWAESRIGEGTVFYVSLPVLQLPN